MESFIEYRGLARDTNLAGRVQANMLMVRMNVKDFIITGSDKDLKQYDEYVEKTNVFLAEAQVEIQDPARARNVDLAATSLKDYEDSFKRVVAARDERNNLVDNILNINGRDMENALRKSLQHPTSRQVV